MYTATTSFFKATSFPQLLDSFAFCFPPPICTSVTYLVYIPAGGARFLNHQQYMDVCSTLTTSHVAEPTATYFKPLGLCNHQSCFATVLQPPTLNKKIGAFREQGHFDHIKCTCHNLRAEQQAINRIHRLNSTHEDVYFFKLLSENNSAERRMLMVGQLQKDICIIIYIYAGLSRFRDG